MNILQLTSEKDWLVWKFQVQHALKAAGQWEFITGMRLKTMREQEAEGFLLSVALYWAEIHANGYEL